VPRIRNTQSKAAVVRLCLLCVACVTNSAHANPDPAWIAESHHRLRTAFKAPATLPEALDQTWGVLTKERHTLRKPDSLGPLLELIARAARAEDTKTRFAAWRAAGASATPSGLAVLTRGLEHAKADQHSPAALLRAVRDSRSGLVHVWLIEHGSEVLQLVLALPATRVAETRKDFAVTLDACVQVLSTESRREARAMAAALDAALGTAKGDWQTELAALIGRTPSPAGRKLIRRWLKNSKRIPPAALIALAENLPRAGDADAAAILLQLLPATPGDVLEAALVALAELKVEVLRDKGKVIVRQTAKLADEEYRELRLLTARTKRSPKLEQQFQLLTERRTAWTSSRIVDSPPKPLPKGAQGVTGITALWWRVVDAKPKGMRPPTPSKGARLPYFSHRANLSWDEWMNWSKRGR